MIVKRAGNTIHVWTPAKLNLFLEILGRRDDGYHEIETLMSAIDWYDTLSFVPTSSEAIALDCAWADGIEARRNARHLPADCQAFAELPPADDNLVMRAVRLLKQEAAVQQGGEIRLRKRIPAAAGLGGASSDAAAALLAANMAWNLAWPIGRLSEIAARLGSDIPFFFGKQSAVCRGRGELIEPFRVRGVQSYVVVKPAAGLSTAEVYRQCRPAEVARRVEPTKAALESSDPRPETWFFNRLESAALAVSPQLARLQREMENISKSRSFMSGSGTSHFVRCRNARHARRVSALARGRGLGAVCCSVTADRGTGREAGDQYST